MEGEGDYDEDIFDQINKQLFKIINIIFIFISAAQ